MSNILKDKHAVVTGASQGIGLAVAKALASEGAHVAICGRNQKLLEKAVVEIQEKKGGKVVGHVADVSDSRQVADFFHRVDGDLGGLDILINNAGFGVFRATAELTVEEWDKLIGTNLSGAFYCSREALARFERNRNGGFIINISSLAGKNPFAGGAAYNASKFGMNGFSEAMMLDHRNDNVRVSYIMPGSVATHFGGPESANKSWKIAPEDVAEVVLDILRMPQRTLISRIEMRPSRPQKD